MWLAEVVDSHMNTRSWELPEYSLDYVALEHLFNNFHVFSNFQHRMKERGFERRLRGHGENKYFINCHCLGCMLPAACASSIICSGSRLVFKVRIYSSFFFPTLLMLAYCSCLLLDLRAEGMIMRIALYEFCVCALTSCWLSAGLGGPSGRGYYFAEVEDLASRGILLPLPAAVQEIVELIEILRILSDCTFYPVKAYLTYHRLLELIWVHEDCVRCFLFDALSGQVINRPKHLLHSIKRATDGSLIVKNVGGISAKYGLSTLMTLYHTHEAAQAAVVVLDEPQADDVDPLYEEDHVEEAWDCNDLSIQTRHGPSALQQLQARCSNAGMTISSTASDALELLPRGLPAITKNSALRDALESGTDAPASERERLQKKVKALNDDKAASGAKRAAILTAVEKCRLLENARE